MDWKTGCLGFDPWQRQKDFSCNLVCPDQPWGPLSPLSNGYRESFPRAKMQPGCDTDHSPPSSTEVKNE
jgi:hypothetical protein